MWRRCCRLGSCSSCLSSFATIGAGATRTGMRRMYETSNVPDSSAAVHHWDPWKSPVPQRAPRRSSSKPTHPAVQLMEEDPVRHSDTLACIPDADDDIVLDTPASLFTALHELRPETLGKSHKASEKDESSTNSANLTVEVAPSARGVGQDVIDLVTDAFKEQREAEVRRRRRVLYDLTHPQPSHYTYKGKLVPPPPLSFGEITAEARELGNELMLQPTFRLVSQVGTRVGDNQMPPSEEGHNYIEVGGTPQTNQRYSYKKAKLHDNVFRDHNYFFEINEMYQEIVFVGKACAGKSSLLNALLGQSVAKTSSSPNTTRRLNFYQSVSAEELRDFHARERPNQLVKLPDGGRKQLTFVDVPGFGIEGMSDAWRDSAIELTDSYFGVRRSVNTVLFCMDCERGLTKSDVKYFKWLENIQGVFYIVLTKCDSVPHSRVCSVMRQVYSLITKHRRRFRRVFPYIIPTSAQDGSNIELLRGLIAETSGFVPGDVLRDILQRRQQTDMQQALLAEAARLEEVRLVERNQARSQFQLPSTPAQISAGKHAEQSALASTQIPGSSVELFLDESARAVVEGECGLDAGEGATPAQLRRQQRERFLSWRTDHPHDDVFSPYRGDGGRAFRANSGLDGPQKQRVQVDMEGSSSTPLQKQQPNSAAGDDCTLESPPDAQPPNAARAKRSSVLGLEHLNQTAASTNPTPRTGVVSTFLQSVNAFGEQKLETSRQHRRRRGRRDQPRLVVEDQDGRVAAYVAGKRRGPSLVSLDTPLESRQAAWKAKQLKELLQRESSTAPWTAVGSLAAKVEESRQQSSMRKMRAKDKAAYARHAGGIIGSFEKFEGEVTTAKFMNETRQAPTLRSREQMHLNATAKINYRSMPAGLWKRYGEGETYWPTPRVLGRGSPKTASPATKRSSPPRPRK